MKKWFRVLAIILVVAMTLSLAGCDSADYKKAIKQYQEGDYESALAGFEDLGDYKRSKELAQKCEEKLALVGSSGGNFGGSTEKIKDLNKNSIVGQWRSNEIDCTDLLMSGIYDSLTAETEEVMDYFHFDDFKLILTLTFAEDGTVVETVDLDHFMKSVDNLSDALYDAFLAYIEDVFTEVAKEEGLTYQDILDFYEASDTAELCREAAGMDLNDLIASSVTDPCKELAKEMEESGTYTVKGDRVDFTFDTGTDVGEFDAASGTLTLSGEGVEDDFKMMYPITFAKVK